ncbi:hypothetical protein GH733_016793 [Mirounga leonina]|nr:hypothetical protein GH733_016793 [Mirounga leonina]
MERFGSSNGKTSKKTTIADYLPGLQLISPRLGGCTPVLSPEQLPTYFYEKAVIQATYGPRNRAMITKCKIAKKQKSMLLN